MMLFSLRLPSWLSLPSTVKKKFAVKKCGIRGLRVAAEGEQQTFGHTNRRMVGRPFDQSRASWNLATPVRKIRLSVSYRRH